METTLKIDQNIHIITFSGRVDSYSLAKAREQIDEALKSRPANIVINMQSVIFMDSSGLSLLVVALKKARERQGDLRLCCLQQPVRMVLELTRLDKVFEIFATEAEAIQAFVE